MKETFLKIVGWAGKIVGNHPTFIEDESHDKTLLILSRTIKTLNEHLALSKRLHEDLKSLYTKLEEEQVEYEKAGKYSEGAVVYRLKQHVRLLVDKYCEEE